MKDQISDISVELVNVSQNLKAIVALIDSTNRLTDDADMVCNAVCSVMEHIERIAHQLDQMSLDSNHQTA